MSMPVNLSGLNIQLRVQAPYDIVLTTGLAAGDLTAESVKVAMDMLTEVADRERLKAELASLRRDLQQSQDMLTKRTFERQITAIRRERAKLDNEISLKWINTAHRGEPKLSGAQQTQMAGFEAQIEKALQNKQDVENGILLTLWQIDCVQARLAGQPVPPMSEETVAALADLEMPEDIGFTPQLVA